MLDIATELRETDPHSESLRFSHWQHDEAHGVPGREDQWNVPVGFLRTSERISSPGKRLTNSINRWISKNEKTFPRQYAPQGSGKSADASLPTLQKFFRIEIDEQKAVQELLLASSSLRDLLLLTALRLRNSFHGAQFHLEINRETETTEEPQLLIVISPAVPPAEALVQWNAFKQNWWLQVWPRVGNKLGVTISYR